MRHGAFGWFELMTTDPEGAKKFYSDLFGWEYEDMPMGPGFIYTVVRSGGKAVAGIMAQPEDCKGMPPSWDVYITSDDVDATAARVVATGGRILRAPADIQGVGRFAVLEDPQGAVFIAMTYLGN